MGHTSGMTGVQVARASRLQFQPWKTERGEPKAELASSPALCDLWVGRLTASVNKVLKRWRRVPSIYLGPPWAHTFTEMCAHTNTQKDAFTYTHATDR